MKKQLVLAALGFALAYLPASSFAAEAPPPAAAGGGEPDAISVMRATLRLDTREFVKKALNLNEEDGKKFWSLYYQYEADLMKLNDKRLENIKDYASNFGSITEAKADELVKHAFEFRKARTSLLEKYYGKIAKATTKTIGARFLQVENVLQGAGDVEVGTSLPLIPKE